MSGKNIKSYLLHPFFYFTEQGCSIDYTKCNVIYIVTLFLTNQRSHYQNFLYCDKIYVLNT